MAAPVHVKRLPVGIRKVRKHAGGASGTQGHKASYFATSCVECHYSYKTSGVRRSPPCPKCKAVQPEQTGWVTS